MTSLTMHLKRILSKSMRLIAAVSVVGAVVFSAGSAIAQSGAGSIQGTVTDSTGAVIPGAAIHVVNRATGVSENTKSNSVGFYQVPGLFAGTYSVTVTVPNMKTYATRIQLLVSQTAVINPVMIAGAVTQQVQVSANLVQLTTTSSGALSSTLENQRISQLPMNGRVLSTLLAMTTPGLEGGSTGGTMLNGIQGASVAYVADGAPLDNREFGGTNTAQAQEPDPDAIQEVRVATTNASAQFAAPGTVVITTKSGTNRLHGTAFWTARNNAIGIAKARQDPANFTAPKYIRNEFGVSAGGPIILPHVYHGKDKSFWFMAYERYSLASASSQLFSVPTQAMRGGDFSALLTLAAPVQLYDPATTYNAAKCPATGKLNAYCRKPFVNDQIPVGRESPTMKIINDITPLPNLTENPLVTPNLQGPDESLTVIPTWTFRLDHAFNQNNHVYLRNTINLDVSHRLRDYPGNEPALGGADGFPPNATGVAYYPVANFAPAIGYTHIFSPTFFSETVLSNQWFNMDQYPGGPVAANYEKMLGLPNNFGETGFPIFGLGSLINPISGTQFSDGISQIVTNLDENLTKTMGRQQIQFGGRYRHERFGYLPSEKSDSVAFTNQATGLYNTATGENYGGLPHIGNQNGDAFLGAANSYGVNLEPPYEHFHDMEFDLYFQDDYHMTRNLTWNLGLRYEAHPAPWLKYGLMNTFDLKNDALALASTPQQLIARGYTTQPIITNLENIGVKLETFSQAGIPANGVRNYNLNFEPRLGFAYQPFGGKHGTVIRGGYGRYLYPTPVRTLYGGTVEDVPFSATYHQNYSDPAQSPDGIKNYLLRNPQPNVMGVDTSNVVDSNSVNAIVPGSIGPTTLPADLPPTVVTETNFTIEQPLKGNSALRVSWIWTHGTNLLQSYMFNNHPSTYAWEIMTGTIPPQGTTIGLPTYAATATGPYDQTTWSGSLKSLQKSGWSNDNELEVNYQRLYHKGLAYQIFYVWSKPLRVGSDYQAAKNVMTPIYPAQNYVNSGLGTMTPVPNSSPITAPVMPPQRPAGIASYASWHQLNVYENYELDTVVPKQHIQFNWILDLPFGRGNRYLSNANSFLNELLGGFQLAGYGSVTSQDFQVDSSNWGPTSAIHTYKHAHKVTDCRSGTCIEAFQWFNGYIAPSNLPSSGCSTVVTGLPANWTPYSQPIDTNYNPVTSGTCGQAQDQYYNTNDVQINLLNGTADVQGYSPGPLSVNPWAKTFLNGPMNYHVDLSVFKVFPITESMRLRFNMDAFNALNVQGYNNPGAANGIENMLASHNTPRQIQLTLRLQF